ncbi:MAG: fibrillarin-like rRNA/tRNA 2'-O-methyltransferase [Candidatus Altiarchaeota archaeon]|nr:fibrillarin-like rRNA/tRNA 2'-O-methyltransferase [Candidatus Altiarchaeota archaeon]
MEGFPGVYRIGKALATENLSPGSRVYGEELVEKDGKELRMWNPHRSKLAAAILKGLRSFPFKEESNVLYLGASTGTTPSHVSDICRKGRVYCVEFSETSMRKLLDVCKKRPNTVPMLQDARRPEAYQYLVGGVDVIYQDVAQPDQAGILINNARTFLKPGEYAMIAIKARSVDSVKSPKEVFEKVKGELSGSFEIAESVDLRPYDDSHELVVCRLKG